LILHLFHLDKTKNVTHLSHILTRFHKILSKGQVRPTVVQTSSEYCFFYNELMFIRHISGTMGQVFYFALSCFLLVATISISGENRAQLGQYKQINRAKLYGALYTFGPQKDNLLRPLRAYEDSGEY